jgi:hypothetical protein
MGQNYRPWDKATGNGMTKLPVTMGQNYRLMGQNYRLTMFLLCLRELCINYGSQQAVDLCACTSNSKAKKQKRREDKGKKNGKELLAMLERVSPYKNVQAG